MTQEHDPRPKRWILSLKPIELIALTSSQWSHKIKFSTKLSKQIWISSCISLRRSRWNQCSGDQSHDWPPTNTERSTNTSRSTNAKRPTDARRDAHASQHCDHVSGAFSGTINCMTCSVWLIGTNYRFRALAVYLLRQVRLVFTLNELCDRQIKMFAERWPGAIARSFACKGRKVAGRVCRNGDRDGDPWLAWCFHPLNLHGLYPWNLHGGSPSMELQWKASN